MVLHENANSYILISKASRSKKTFEAFSLIDATRLSPMGFFKLTYFLKSKVFLLLFIAEASNTENSFILSD